MYDYRKLTAEQQCEVVLYRHQHGRPWHSPPHWEFTGAKQFLISAACYEHAPVIGATLERMTECENKLLEICAQYGSAVYAWCILPNHYHLLLKTDQQKALLAELGRFHGRSSYEWNLQDACTRRKTWHRCFDRDIRSHRHFWASVNYVHHNPV
ncbi:MAG: transposase [Acidobacteria bacterium]|nr:transposase [Acidobacteriota bacterium]